MTNEKEKELVKKIVFMTAEEKNSYKGEIPDSLKNLFIVQKKATDEAVAKRSKT
jgi:hypothetical protein